MRAAGLITGVGVGWLLGAVLGLVDGAAARDATFAAGADVYRLGVLIDGGVGAVLGAVVGLLIGRGQTKVGVASGVVALLVTVGGLIAAAGGSPDPETRGAPAPPGTPSVWWIAVHGLDAETMSALPDVADASVALPRVYAAHDDPEAALAAMWSGRHEPGRTEDAPTVAEGFRWAGFTTAAVVHRTAGRASLRGFDQVRVPSQPHPWGLEGAAERLWIPSLAAPAAAPATAAQLADAALTLGSGLGEAHLLFVELPADAEAIGSLVRGAPTSAVVMISTITGPAGNPGLGVRTVSAPAWVRLPGGELAGAAFPHALSAVSLGPSLFRLVGTETADLWDGQVLTMRSLRRAVAESPVAATAGDPCIRHHRERSRVGVASVGAARVLRHAGYVWVSDATGQALYDEVADPFWAIDLLGPDRNSCGQVPAERAERMRQGFESTWTASAEGAARGIPDRPAFKAANALFPDPP